MSILLGLFTALSWGVGDFYAGYSTKRIGTYRTTFFIHLIGFIAISCFLIFTQEWTRLSGIHDWRPWFWEGVAIVTNILGTFCIMHAFKIGPFMLVSPITSSYSAITILLAILAGEELTLIHALGMGAVLGGVIITSLFSTSPASTEVSEERAIKRLSWISPGVFFAVAAAILYGLSLFVIGKEVSPSFGSFLPTWFFRLVASISIFLLAWPFRQNIKLPNDRKTWVFLLIVSLCDTLALVLYTLGSTLGQLSLLTIISSLYSAVTIFLAALVLKERINIKQWLGVLVIFLGLILVNL